MEDEHARDLRLAWQYANLARARKLPPLRDLLARIRPSSRQQTPQEQLSVLHTISARLGVQARKRKVTRGQ